MLPLTLILAVVGADAAGCAALKPDECVAARRLRPRDVVEEVRRSGTLDGPAVVEGDLDLSTLVPPASRNGAISFSKVEFRGRLSGTPRARLTFSEGSVCSVSMGEGRAGWRHDFEMHSVGVARLLFHRGRFKGEFICTACKICLARFPDAEFERDAMFSGTHFGAKPPPTACGEQEPVPESCPGAHFHESTFLSAARFDRVQFLEGATFDGAEFRGSARFAEAVATGPVSFVGSRFRSDAEFRGGRYGSLAFGSENPGAYEATEFAGRSDFRGCTFSGPLRFDGTVFLGDATFARAKASGGPVSFRGVLPGHAIDLRGLTLEASDARVLLDAAGAEAVRLEWSAQGTAVLRGAPDPPDAEFLSVLSARLEAAGERRASREVAYQAEGLRRRKAAAPAGPRDPPTNAQSGEAWGSRLASSAEWYLWKVPTHNGSDPTLVLTLLACLWFGSALVAARRDGSVVLPTPLEKEKATPAWALADPSTLPEGTSKPSGLCRAGAAARFATTLVFKLGSSRVRCLAPSSDGAAAVLRASLLGTSLFAWALLGVLTAVIAASFPGLNFLKPGG